MTWGPSGGHEVLTHGEDEPARRPLGLLAAVAGTGLVIGLLAGIRLAPEPAPVAEPAGWSSPLTDTRAATIAGRSWGRIGFSAPPDCMTYPADVRVVHVRIWTDSDTLTRPLRTR